MYALTKLSKDSQDFITNLTINNQSRSLVATLALARCLAYKAELPSSPIDDVESYYRSNCQITDTTMISKINELSILDIDSVIQYAKKFFMFRYSVVHDDCYAVALNKEYAIADYFKISKSIDRVAIDTICEQHIKVTQYTNSFYKLISELKEEKSQP